jgi:hypothetical protein
MSRRHLGEPATGRWLQDIDLAGHLINVAVPIENSQRFNAGFNVGEKKIASVLTPGLT